MGERFNWKFYINYYKDLEVAGIDTKEKAEEHWKKHGIHEKRYGNMDWRDYIEKNEEIKKEGVRGEEKSIEHWIMKGKKEGREIKGKRMTEIKKIRILITEFLFPIVYGKWRVNEINYFMDNDEYECDFYVESFYDVFVISIGETVEEVFEKYYKIFRYLDDYNILIFNPKFNILNKFNKNIDGKNFNNLFGGDFMLTKSKNIPSMKEYDVFYGIFATSYFQLLTNISKNNWINICKIYPGGGYTNNPESQKYIYSKLKETNAEVIVTQDFIFNEAVKYLDNNKVHKVYGVPVIGHEEIFDDNLLLLKSRRKELHVCFSSMSNDSTKGFDNYLSVIEHFKNCTEMYNIVFHAIGIYSNIPSRLSEKIICHKVMNPSDLSYFYQSEIDVIISPNKKRSGLGPSDGFPLGSEAMVCGCIPIMCDLYNTNINFGFNNTNSFIMNTFNLDYVVKSLITLHNDPKLRLSMAQNIIKKSRDFFSTDNQIFPISQIIKLSLAWKYSSILLGTIPTDIVGGCSLNKAHLIINLIIKHKLTTCVDIGVYRGRSLIPMIIATSYINGYVYGIDPYNNSSMQQKDLPNDIKDIFNRFIETCDLESIYINLINLLSSSGFFNYRLIRLPSSLSSSFVSSINLLHIDGNHDTSSVNTDISSYIHLVSSNGFIIMNATNLPSVVKSLHLLNNYAKLVHNFDTWQIWKKI